MKCCILYLFLRAELSVYLGCEESVPACSTSSIKVSPSSGHMTSDGKIFRKYYQKLFHRLLAATASSHQILTRGRSRAWPAWFRKTNFLKIPPTGNIRGWVAQLKISRPDSLPAPPCFIKITGLSLEPPRQIIIIFLATIQRQFWCDEKIFRAAILEIILDSPSYCRKTHTHASATITSEIFSFKCLRQGRDCCVSWYLRWLPSLFITPLNWNVDLKLQRYCGEWEITCKVF